MPARSAALAAAACRRQTESQSRRETETETRAEERQRLLEPGRQTCAAASAAACISVRAASMIACAHAESQRVRESESQRVRERERERGIDAGRGREGHLLLCQFCEALLHPHVVDHPVRDEIDLRAQGVRESGSPRVRGSEGQREREGERERERVSIPCPQAGRPLPLPAPAPEAGDTTHTAHTVHTASTQRGAHAEAHKTISWCNGKHGAALTMLCLSLSVCLSASLSMQNRDLPRDLPPRAYLRDGRLEVCAVCAHPEPLCKQTPSPSRLRPPSFSAPLALGS